MGLIGIDWVADEQMNGFDQRKPNMYGNTYSIFCDALYA